MAKTDVAKDMAESITIAADIYVHNQTVEDRDLLASIQLCRALAAVPSSLSVDISHG